MNKAAIRERIELAIVEEINLTNLIAQKEPENYIPQFIKNLTERLYELFLDELTYRK